jgi:methylglutaconyl-CoA hydratase
MGTNRVNGSIYTSVSNKIATVEFGHPASNSFVSEMLDRLANELKTLSDDESVNLIILKSEGEKTFCAGASFTELVQVTNEEEGKEFFSGFAKVINAMKNCKHIIIGRVHGKAVGGGVGLAAACDYVFAHENASIKLSEISLGIAPFVIAPALIRKIGESAFTDLSLSAKEWKTAYWAKEKGLYAKVFNTIEDLDSEIDLFSTQLSSYNKVALQELKKVFWKSASNWDVELYENAELTGKLVLSKSTQDALAHFKKK